MESVTWNFSTWILCCLLRGCVTELFLWLTGFQNKKTRLEFLFPKKCPSILGVALGNALGAASLCLSCDEERLLGGWILHVE